MRAVRVALGLDLYLGQFAREWGAETSRSWGGDNWRFGLYTVASSTETQVYWNLTGVNVLDGLQRASRNVGGPTDWELLQFKEHPDWIERSRWCCDGGEVPCPDEMM